MPVAEAPHKTKRGSRKMQYLQERFRVAHPEAGVRIDPDDIASWAIREKLWQPKPTTHEQQLARLIRRSLRETYITDPQGREVRANLPIMEDKRTSEGWTRKTAWYPLFSATAEVARTSFALRRRAAFRDCQQLHFDFLSWNENNASGDSLEPMDYNFNADLADAAMSTTYSDEPMEDPFAEEDDDDE